MAEDGARGSSPPFPPRLLARLRDFAFDVEAEISFRNGLGWSGIFSPRRDGVPGIKPTVSDVPAPPMERLVDVDDC